MLDKNSDSPFVTNSKIADEEIEWKRSIPVHIGALERKIWHRASRGLKRAWLRWQQPAKSLRLGGLEGTAARLP